MIKPSLEIRLNDDLNAASFSRPDIDERILPQLGTESQNQREFSVDGLIIPNRISVNPADAASGAEPDVAGFVLG